MNDIVDAETGEVIESTKAGQEVVPFGAELHSKIDQFSAALPAHIPAERFARVLMTAVQANPKLLRCDRRSFWRSALQCAQDGLLPDGREAVIIERWSKDGPIAGYQPMVAGIRKKARNSGEIATWDVQAVYEADEFDFQLGDDPRIHHKPKLGERGKIIAVYSVATLKTGEKSRDVMSMSEVERVRDRYSDGWKAFKAGKIKSTPWADSPEEMAKKTVARRHSKVLPMSTDLDDLLRRDDELYNMADRGDAAVEHAERPKTLGQRLDALAAGIETPPAETSQSAAEGQGPGSAAGSAAAPGPSQDAPATGGPRGGVTLEGGADHANGVQPSGTTAQTAPKSEVTGQAGQAEAVSKPPSVAATKATDAAATSPKQAAAAEGEAKPPASPAVLTPDEKRGLRNLHEDLMKNHSKRKLDGYLEAFVKFNELTEGMPAWAAARTLYDAHIERAAGRSNPTEADAVMNKVLA